MISRWQSKHGRRPAQAGNEIRDLQAVLEDLAAKVEDLEAVVKEKEATRKTIRDAFSQMAGTPLQPTPALFAIMHHAISSTSRHTALPLLLARGAAVLSTC